MIESELNDSIKQTFDTCALHLKRLEFAKSRVGTFIPLNRDNKTTGYHWCPIVSLNT